MNVKLDDSWKNHLNHHINSEQFRNLVDFVKAEYQDNVCYPKGSLIFSALNNCVFDKVKLVILGQDPYHAHGQAHGLCFSVQKRVLRPPSLKNIYRELYDDLGVEIADHGCLSLWASQGVFLLNSILTVENKKPGSHRNKGWEKFTDQVIKFLLERKKNLAFVLWGNYASEKGKFIKSKDHLILRSSHPSPFSAHRGFFGSRPFSKINLYLNEHKINPINWNLS